MTRMLMERFHPIVRDWFGSRFEEPTAAQRLGWPSIAAANHTLIAAPTGSGKTLAAFLVCLDQLWQDWLAGNWQDGVQVVYVSPLKALSNDIERNLRTPLNEIAALAAERNLVPAPIRVAVRTGDTPPSERQAMLRRPPHILVTTPESLYLLLTSERGREPLRRARTLIVDEIHAVARDKRGSHLMLSAERLAALAEQPLVRIGLSATQKPIDRIARFLVGNDCREVNLIDTSGSDATGTRRLEAASGDGCRVNVVDTGHVRDLDLACEVPPSELSAACSTEQWGEVYTRLTQLIEGHRSTLVFVNTRRFAERVTHRLTATLGEGAVASHHGSLSREIRMSAEHRLKEGQLKAIVATASLEMGIDIGYIDLVCQVGSPRSIASFLQRVGRSGHSLGEVPRGRLFPLTRDELLECMALARAVHHGILDTIEIPDAPLDILAQQIVAAVAVEPWDEADLFQLCRRAWPYRELQRESFDRVVKFLSEGLTPTTRRGAYLHRDRINGRVRARRSARLAAITAGGAIPEMAEYRVVAEPNDLFVGTVDEHFAIDSHIGDVFLLGNTSWRVQHVRASQVVVQDAGGAPPSIPFWFGEAPGRTIELSHELSTLREMIAERLQAAAAGTNEGGPTKPRTDADLAGWLQRECGVDSWGAQQALAYVAAQLAAIGTVPTDKEIVFERFFDESGGMQLVIHSPLGTRINRAWGLALRKRFCRSFDFELQAAATDNGVLLSIGPQHSFPIDAIFKMIGPHNARYLLEQAVLAAPMFQVRWRWNVTRALAVLRNHAGKRVPPHLQRLRSDDLLAAAFPETVGCLENHHGDVEIPDHPLVQQTMQDCLHEAMDLHRWIELLEQVGRGEVRFVPRDTREPSPFCYELLNANPYSFLDDAPLEERRTRAVQTRRSLTPSDVRDLAWLDATAIEQVRREAWPVVRDADELHDALLQMVLMPVEAEPGWRTWFQTLLDERRAAVVYRGDVAQWWIAAESWPVAHAVHEDVVANPDVQLPANLAVDCDRMSAVESVVSGRIQFAGPCTAEALGKELQVATHQVFAALEALEGKGIVLRGRFLPGNGTDDEAAVDWCDRRLLSRIHRLTMDGLRRRIKPVPPADYLRFLTRRHRLIGDQSWAGQVGLHEAVAQLQGFEMPAGAWERVLAMRLDGYDEHWLDCLFLSGELTWGRIRFSRRNEDTPTAAGAWNRTVPISLLLRRDLDWLLAGGEKNGEATTDRRLPVTSADAQSIVQTLSSRGALFFSELLNFTGLTAEALEEALRELAALGSVTSDMFAAVRRLVKRPLGDPRRATASGLPPPTGRWSCFPGEVAAMPTSEERQLRWCHLLLQRYGVLFRDLLTRESAAPPWRDLVRTLRRMELRGEVRGGRFVEGVAGEQYAEPDAVEQLRQVRETAASDEWLLVAAADPLNLAGIIGGGSRVPATHRNYLILAGGRWVASRQADRIEFWEDTPEGAAEEMQRALATGHHHSRREMTTLPSDSSRATLDQPPAETNLRRRTRLGAINQL
jgi:ATP-dependent Lhr-like helicase